MNSVVTWIKKKESLPMHFYRCAMFILFHEAVAELCSWLHSDSITVRLCCEIFFLIFFINLSPVWLHKRQKGLLKTHLELSRFCKSVSSKTLYHAYFYKVQSSHAWSISVMNKVWITSTVRRKILFLLCLKYFTDIFIRGKWRETRNSSY